MTLMLIVLATFLPKHWATVTLPTSDSGPSCATTAPWPMKAAPFCYLAVYQGPDSASAMAHGAMKVRWGLSGLAPGSTFAFPVWPDTLGPLWYAVVCCKRADSVGTPGPESCPFRAMRVR